MLHFIFIILPFQLYHIPNDTPNLAWLVPAGTINPKPCSFDQLVWLVGLGRLVVWIPIESPKNEGIGIGILRDAPIRGTQTNN